MLAYRRYRLNKEQLFGAYPASAGTGFFRSQGMMPGKLKPVPFLNLTAGAWIQYMNHDWVSYGEPANAAPYRIPLDPDDPARRTLRQTHMLVRPTQTDPTHKPGEPSTHINEVTSWWDGSQIYGSDAKTADALRSRKQGKLTIDPKTGNLPILTSIF